MVIFQSDVSLPEGTHLGMVYTTYLNGGDWGMVYGIVLTTLIMKYWFLNSTTILLNNYT